MNYQFEVRGQLSRGRGFVTIPGRVLEPGNRGGLALAAIFAVGVSTEMQPSLGLVLPVIAGVYLAGLGAGILIAAPTSNRRHAHSYTGTNSSLTRPSISGCHYKQKSTLRPRMATGSRP